MQSSVKRALPTANTVYADAPLAAGERSQELGKAAETAAVIHRRGSSGLIKTVRFQKKYKVGLKYIPAGHFDISSISYFIQIRLFAVRKSGQLHTFYVKRQSFPYAMSKSSKNNMQENCLESNT
jgi:hypothetical protein